MNIKTLLLVAPLVTVAVLLQAVLWVPAYDPLGANSYREDPRQRLVKERFVKERFVEASSGDAKTLNPILNSDSSSSRITDLVFDGLLGLDEDLSLRGRLAKAWTLDETAYLVVRDFDGEGPADATPQLRLLERLRTHIAATPELDKLIASIAIEAPRWARANPDPGYGLDSGSESGSEQTDTGVEVFLPTRVAFTLSRVTADLYDLLKPALGKDYDADFDPRTAARFRRSDSSGQVEKWSPSVEQARALLPLMDHRPRIRFELRQGVRFHDGHPFDAQDVAFTYRALMDTRNLSPRRSDFEPIDRVEIVDDHTVDVFYKRLFSPAVNAWVIGILPQHLLDDEAREAEIRAQDIDPDAREAFGMRQFGFNRQPVGTGAFMFKEWRSGEHIRLARNPDYWDGPPNYDDYYFRVLPDPLTREIEFRAGSVDTYVPEPHQAARYRASEAYQSFSTAVLGYTYIGYNLRKAPFDDVRVRRALSMAIDVEALIAHVLYRQGERTTGPYPISTPWYDPGVPAVPFDPEGAKALLREAGWLPNSDGWLERDGEPLTFNLITNNGNAVRKAVLAIAQDAWRSIGVQVQTQVFEWAVFLKDFVNPGDFDAVVLGWRTGIDADQFQIWHSSQTGPNQLNFVGYKSQEADRLMLQLRREYDPQVQQRLAHALHRQLAADLPYTFLFIPKVTRVLDRKIVMVENGAVGPVRVGRGGDVFFHMNRWIEMSHAP